MRLNSVVHLAAMAVHRAAMAIHRAAMAIRRAAIVRMAHRVDILAGAERAVNTKAKQDGNIRVQIKAGLVVVRQLILKLTTSLHKPRRNQEAWVACSLQAVWVYLAVPSWPTNSKNTTSASVKRALYKVMMTDKIMMTDKMAIIGSDHGNDDRLSRRTSIFFLHVLGMGCEMFYVH